MNTKVRHKYFCRSCGFFWVSILEYTRCLYCKSNKIKKVKNKCRGC